MTISDDDALLISRSLDGDLPSKETKVLKARSLQEPELRELYDALAADQLLINRMTSNIDSVAMPAEIIDQLKSQLGEDKPGLFRWQMITAAIAVVAIGGTFLISNRSVPTLAEVLSEETAGDQIAYQGGTVDLIATFRTADHWCREYVTESTRAAACYVNGDWKTMASEPTTGDNASRTAGNGSSKVESFVLENMIENPPHPNAERVMLRTLD